MARVVPVSSYEEFEKIHTGEANAGCAHLAVPVYMPLAEDVSHDEALGLIAPELRRQVERGEAELVALACGTMLLDGRRHPLRLALFRQERSYMTFNPSEGEYEMAVLMDGDGRRYLKPDPLPRDEAMRQWMSGFVGWSCEVPGLYDLRYAFVSEPAPPGGTGGSPENSPA